MDCHLALKVANILFYGGFVLLILGICVGSVGNSDVLSAVFGIPGIVGVAAGLVWDWLYVRCPRCGASLTRGRSVPTWLPKHCPECGEKV